MDILYKVIVVGFNDVFCLVVDGKVSIGILFINNFFLGVWLRMEKFVLIGVIVVNNYLLVEWDLIELDDLLVYLFIWVD